MLKLTLILGILLSTSLSFAGNFHHSFHHNNVVDVIIKRVEFDNRYYLGLDGYYSVGQELVDGANAEKLSRLETQLERLSAQNEILLKLLAGEKIPEVPTSPQPTQPTQPVEPPVVQPEQPSTPNIPANPTSEASNLDKKVYDIFSRRCANCHGDLKQDGGLVLIKKGILQGLPLADRVEVHHRVNGVNLGHKARMPKGSTPLSDIEVEDIRLWVVEEADRLRNGE
jgi:hypothetical protein